MKHEYSLHGYEIMTQQQSTLGNKMDYMHIHDGYEISLCLEGEVKVYNGNECIHICAPFVRLYRPYTFHRVEPDVNIRYTRINAYFTEECLMERGYRLVELSRVFTTEMAAYALSAEQAEQLRLMFTALVQAADKRTKRFLLAAILNEFELLESGHPVPANVEKYHYISDVIRYINEHFTEPLNSRALAERHFISVAKLDRDFKTYTQTTVRSFIVRVRLKKAASLLADHSVADAAYKSGFNDVSHFIRTFHAHYHQSPLQYEKARREAENI